MGNKTPRNTVIKGAKSFKIDKDEETKSDNRDFEEAKYSVQIDQFFDMQDEYIYGESSRPTISTFENPKAQGISEAIEYIKSQCTLWKRKIDPYEWDSCPKCSQKFHKTCIQSFIKKNSSWPEWKRKIKATNLVFDKTYKDIINTLTELANDVENSGSSFILSSNVKTAWIPHKEKSDYFCLECNEIVCIQCFAEKKHNDCEVQRLSMQYEEWKQRFFDARKDIMEVVKHNEDKKEFVDDLVQNNEAKINQAVDAFTSNVIEAMDKQLSDVLKVSDKMVDSSVQHLKEIDELNDLAKQGKGYMGKEPTLENILELNAIIDKWDNSEAMKRSEKASKKVAQKAKEATFFNLPKDTIGLYSQVGNFEEYLKNRIEEEISSVLEQLDVVF